MKPKFGTVLALAAFLMLPAARPKAAEHVIIMTDFPPVPMHAALYVAKANGWYDGLDVEIQDGRGTNNTLALLAAGQVDIGYVELGPVMSARQQGLPVTSIAVFTRKTDLGLGYDAKLGNPTPKQLAEKPILCIAGSFWQPFIKPFFAKAGVADTDTLSILNVDPAALWPSFMAGKADAILSSTPYGLPMSQKVRPARAIMADQYGIVLPGYGLVVKDDTLTKRRAMLVTVAKATARGWQYLMDGHEDQAIADMEKLRPSLKLDPVVAKEVIKSFEKLVYTPSTKGKPMGWQSEQDWKQAMATGENAGLIKPGHKLSDFYTNAVIDAK